MTAHDHVRWLVCKTRPVVVSEKANLTVVHDIGSDICGVEPQSAIFTSIADRTKEIALATPNLDHLFPADAVPLDDPASQARYVLLEQWRECLVVLVASAIHQELLGERQIGNETAFSATGKMQISARYLTRRLGRAEREILEDRYASAF
jgi:hypothetical protein